MSEKLPAVLGDLFAPKLPSVDPRKFPDEEFELYSVPAYERRRPDYIVGSEIGSSKIQVSPGDVLLCRIVPHIRRAWVVPVTSSRRQIASSEWMVLRGAGAHPDYIRQLVLSDQFHRQFMSTVAGVGGSLLRARPAQAATIPVSLPPLPEQRRIAAILDEASASARLRAASFEQVSGLRDAIFRERLGSPGSPVNPDHKFTLGQVAEVATGGTPSRSRPEFYKGTIPWVKTGEINMSVIDATEEHITAEALAVARLKLFPPNSIVIAMYGQGVTRGRSAILGLEAATNQACAVVLPSQRYRPMFMAHQMSMLYQELRNMGRGGSQENLNLALVRSLSITLPPLAEQLKIESDLDQIAQYTSLVEQHSRSSEALRQSLMATAFDGTGI